MLRLVIDTEGLSLEHDPRVVYLGHSAQKAQEAIDASDSEKLSIVEIPILRRAKKTPFTEPHPATVTAPPQPQDDLEEFTVDGLKELAEDEGIDLSGLELKAEIVAGVRAFRQLDENNTVDALKEIAAREDVDLTGAHRKVDYINAIARARRAKK